MKKIFLLFLPFLFISCFTTKTISNNNLYDATKSAAKIESITEQLSSQSNIEKKLNLKENEILKKTDDLINELEYSIEYEKTSSYNEGVKDGYSIGYKDALTDFLKEYKEGKTNEE